MFINIFHQAIDHKFVRKMIIYMQPYAKRDTGPNRLGISSPQHCGWNQLSNLQNKSKLAEFKETGFSINLWTVGV